MSINQLVLVPQENTYSAHRKFSENTQTEKMVDGSGKLDERNSSSAQIRTLFEEQRQMIIAEYCEKISHHELSSSSSRRRTPNSTRRIMATRNWNFVKLINKILQRWRNYKNSRVLPSIRSQDESSSRTRTTILEFSGRLQELQNEVNGMNDAKDFQDAESVRSGNSHVTSRPVSFPPHPIPEGMLSRSFGVPSRREGPPSIWDTHGMSGNVFVNPDASSSAPYPQELNQWSSSIVEPLHSSTVEESEREMPVWTVSQKFRHLQWRRLFKELWGRPTTTADF